MTPGDFREWRRCLGWTQVEAAAKLGLSVRTVKHYEGGTRGISPVVEKLTHAIGRRGSGAFWKNASGRLVARSDIATPPRACRWLRDVIAECYTIRSILDPCAGDGRLTKPWHNVRVVQTEIAHGSDFLALTALPWKPDLVLCNPPFNGTRYKQWRLGSEAFLHKIFELCGEDQKIVLFSPMGLRLNVERRAARAKHLPTWNITSLVALSRDFFGKDVTVHAEILFFNMPRLKPHYALR
jgi:transcriptional regulator with XRE-family HTH domain